VITQERGWDYLWGLKGNQSGILERAENLMNHQASPLKSAPVRYRDADGSEMFWRYGFVVCGGAIQQDKTHDPAMARLVLEHHHLKVLLLDDDQQTWSVRSRLQ